MKRYLFFLRHFNDIDNISPAIYYALKKNEDLRADLLIYSDDYDFRTDVNLNLLKETFSERFSVRWLGEYFDFEIDKHFEALKKDKSALHILVRVKRKLVPFIERSLILRKIYSSANKLRTSIQIKTKNSGKVIPQILEGNFSPEVTREKIKDILEEYTFPSLVAFDINRTYAIKGLLDALRANGVKNIIALPVSPLINYNVMRQYDFYDIDSDEFLAQNDYSGFDKIGYVCGNYIENFNSFFEFLGKKSTLKGKTAVIGSIRFTKEWIDIRSKFVKPYTQTSGKRKVLFLLSNPVSNINVRAVKTAIKIFSKYPDFSVLIKPHTRLPGKEIDISSFGNIQYADLEDSSALIDWADIVVFWGSSVALEGYLKNKIMLCMSYLSINKNLYAKYDAGFIARCRDDLYRFILGYQSGKIEQVYNYKGAEKLIKCISSDGESINNYLEFMKKNEF